MAAYRKLTQEEKRLRKLRRSCHAETLEGLIKSWKGISDKAKKKNAAMLASEEDYDAAAQNSWLSVGFQMCIQDLEDTIFLMKSDSDWQPPV